MSIYSGLKISKYGSVSSDLEQNASIFGIPEITSDNEPYVPNEIPENIRTIFQQVQQKFQFQIDNMENQIEFLCSLLKTKSIFKVYQELFANDRLWLQQISLFDFTDSESEEGQLKEIALYLMIWGEASNLRFCPEMLCFIFHLALDAFDSTEQYPKFLDFAIRPLYSFIFNQSYKIKDWKPIRKSKDHSSIVGYDDCNECFWFRKKLDSILITSGQKLFELPPKERYGKLNEVQWNRFFEKTFYEKRTILHLFVNFIQIWHLHLIFFVYFTILNAISNQFLEPIWLGVGGCFSLLMMILAGCLESLFLPRFKIQRRAFLKRFVLSFFLFIFNVSPLALYFLLKLDSSIRNALVVVQILLSFSSSILVGLYPRLHPKQSVIFISNFKQLNQKNKLKSKVIWSLIWIFKLTASYFYLIVPFGPSFGLLLESATYSKPFSLAMIYPKLVFVSFLILNLILFLLDTYIWFILGTSLFGIFSSIHKGISVFAPWKNALAQLPQRMKEKLLLPEKDGLKALWNSFIFSMYRDHLISQLQCQKMIYINDQKPLFFSENPEETDNARFYDSGSEAKRRVHYFAKSLSMTLPKPLTIHEFPASTVLIPHYSESILLTLKELINNRMEADLTLLDYLKMLYPNEWQNFIQDSKLYSQMGTNQQPELQSISEIGYQTIGYCSNDPESVLRTRIWASLRSQTLYRTIAGFSHYFHALNMYQKNSGYDKFRLLVAMQRYELMDQEILNDVEFLLASFPFLQISFLEQIPDSQQPFGNRFYSCLIDSDCEILSNGKRKPRYRIELPGPKILGDGKSDNQNHSLIFTRGALIQLIDANQDHYLEETYKIFNLAREFEDQVAIVGAREFIFSERFGACADVAAGKEYTFGTISQRVTAQLGGRLHYGHADLLNLLFMATRGGVSKGQKGLHLNEDIFAGMTALMRGGEIKHSEYFQCGKGRDLGFSSILGFATKIGSGMGEQMLSREQYYLGVYLPLDRLLTFFYAHPGFHLNNLFSMLSIRCFTFCLVLTVILFQPCKSPSTSSLCFGQQKLILDWVEGCIVAIGMVLMLSYLPFFLQSSLEHGLAYALKRLGKQILSLTPLFEVFNTQIYAHSLMFIGLNVGGSGYISTGRKMTTGRQSFYHLYSQFCHSSIYLGFRLFLMLLFLSVSGMNGVYLAFFWMISISLFFSPFFFNPHQFQSRQFLLDYGYWLKWLFGGSKRDNVKPYWWKEHQNYRSQITGKKATGSTGSLVRSSRLVVIFQQCLVQLVLLTVLNLGWLFYQQKSDLKNLIILAAVSFLPSLLNFGLILLIFALSTVIGLLLAPIRTLRISFAKCLNFMMRFGSVLIFIIWIILLWLLEKNFFEFLLMLLIQLQYQQFYLSILNFLFLSREKFAHHSHYSFLDGQWFREEGISVCDFFLWIRELGCKLEEQFYFSLDFFLGNFLFLILFPLTWIPQFDFLHLRLLLWNFRDLDMPKLSAVISGTTLKKRESSQYYFSVFWFILIQSFLLILLIVMFFVVPLFKLPKFETLFLNFV